MKNGTGNGKLTPEQLAGLAECLPDGLPHCSSFLLEVDRTKPHSTSRKKRKRVKKPAPTPWYRLWGLE